jgi:hypothetical protein
MLLLLLGDIDRRDKLCVVVVVSGVFGFWFLVLALVCGVGM